MYKLVYLNSPDQKFWEVDEKDYLVGRAIEAEIQIEGKGISKRHCRLSFNRGEAFLTDVGSSNGTYVNGVLIKMKKLTPGDRISIGNAILEFRKMAERIEFNPGASRGGTSHLRLNSVISHGNAALKVQEEEVATPNYLSAVAVSQEVPLTNSTPAPEDLIGKLKWVVHQKILPKLYQLNLNYEWRTLLISLFAIFVLLNIALSVPTILEMNRATLLHEITKRGIFYGKIISDEARKAIGSGSYGQINTAFLKEEEGVLDFEVTDVEGRVYSPAVSQGEWSSNPFTNQALDYLKTSTQKGLDPLPQARWIGANEIGIAYPIKTYVPERGLNQSVGVVAIRFAPGSLAVSSANVSRIYIEAFITSLLVGAILIFFIYHLTLHPIKEVTDQVDFVLKGDQERIETKSKMSELDGLLGVVSSALQQLNSLREKNGGEGPVFQEESVELYVDRFRFLAEHSSSPFIILDEIYEVRVVNERAEEITGIREDSGVGSRISEATTDNAFSETVLELCQRAEMSSENGATERLDIAGIDYDIYVSVIRGNDSLVKIYLVGLNTA